MSRKEEAEKLTSDAKELVLLAGRSWTAYAAICDRMIKEELYKEIGFQNFSAWCEEVGDKSAQQSYRMAHTYSELAKHLPEPAIAQMTMSNARDLTQVPESKLTADLVEKATHLTNSKFRKEINKSVPNLHLEKFVHKAFNLEESAAAVLDQALALAKKQEDIKDDAGALEVLCQSYLSGEGQESHHRSAKALVDTIEENIDADKVSTPPSAKGWASVVMASRRFARVFGFAERRVMPAKAPAEERARVN